MILILLGSGGPMFANPSTWVVWESGTSALPIWPFWPSGNENLSRMLLVCGVIFYLSNMAPVIFPHL